MYTDRTEAALILVEKLDEYKDSNAVILAIPRGGVPLGFVISQKLNLPLEVVLSKKIGHPYHKEFAIGAVTLNSRILSSAASEVPSKYIEEETERVRAKLKKRYSDYYGNTPPISLKNKTLIIVDDGIATGNTMLSIIMMLQDEHPQKVVVAIPVAPISSIRNLKASEFVDEVICPLTPPDFYAVGQFYEEFGQVDDKEVIEYLNKANRFDVVH